MHPEGLPGEEARQLVLKPLQAAEELIDQGQLPPDGLFVGPLEAYRPFPEDDDPVRDEKDIGNIMADQDCGKPELSPGMDDHAQDHVLPDGVLTCGRLVEEHYF